MGAKKLKTWQPEAAPVAVDWHLRKEHLSVFQLMTIRGGVGYQAILMDIRNKVVRPFRNQKPYKFTPAEVLRAYFGEFELEVETKPENKVVEQLRPEIRRRVGKRSRSDLWED